MTIDEMIEEQRENAKTQREIAEECFEEHIFDEKEKIEHLRYANEFDQLAEWLEELKELRNMTSGHLYAVAFNRGYLKAEKEVRNKVLDDFVKLASDMPTTETEDGEVRPMWLEEMAEQLKAGGNIELSEYSKSQGNRTGK